MEIIELTTITDNQASDILELMLELDPEITVTADMLRAVPASGAHFFAAVDGGRVVGCATLGVYASPTGLKGHVEDVVVSSSCRGKGLGRLLLEHIISYARGLAPIDLHLTSRPAREAANKLYVSLGFARRETNVYKMVLKKG